MIMWQNIINKYFVHMGRIIWKILYQDHPLMLIFSQNCVALCSQHCIVASNYPFLHGGQKVTTCLLQLPFKGIPTSYLIFYLSNYLKTI
jgi:hypothetical protein